MFEHLDDALGYVACKNCHEEMTPLDEPFSDWYICRNCAKKITFFQCNPNETVNADE